MAEPWTVRRFRDEVLPTAVAPTMEMMLTPAEREVVSLRIVDERRNEVHGSARIGKGTIMLEISTQGRSVGVWLSESDLDSTFERRFYNELQDFISESDFGWGQLRGPVRSLDPEGE